MNPHSHKFISRLAESWFVLPSSYLIAMRSWLDERAWSTTPPSNTPPKRAYEVRDGVALVDMRGFMARDVEDWEEQYGLVNTEKVGDALEAAAGDAFVQSILLNIDSPGGTVQGTPELAERVAAVNAKKPIVSYTKGLMASAAYYAGSQGTVVLAAKSATVGSIGTVMSFFDISEMLKQWGVKAEVIRNEDSPMKGMAFPGTSLSEEQRAFLQAHVNESAALFKQTVRAARPSCKPDAMNGGFFSGSRSVELGLVDQACDEKTAFRTAALLGAARAKK